MLDLTSAFATFPVLETERLILRSLTPDDAGAVFRMMSDPQVIRYIGTPPMASFEKAVQRVERILANFEKHEGICWALADRATGEYLGSCGYWRLMKPHDRAEIGYDLAPHAWGRGLAVEAAGSVLAFGFAQMGLHSVEAQIHPENTASRRVLEKLGFAQEGYFRQNFYDEFEQQFTDTAVFSLLKSDWQK
jgi:ribosomal-protein-alanine N-acetyltransferase